MKTIEDRTIEIKWELMKKVSERNSCYDWRKHLCDEGWSEEDPLLKDFLNKGDNLNNNIQNLKQELIELACIEDMEYIQKENEVFFKLLNI